MKKNIGKALFPSIRIVTISGPNNFEAPLYRCYTDYINMDKCYADPPIPLKLCTCDDFLYPVRRSPSVCGCDRDCSCDCVHCRCDCDDCLCDCDHCRCDCDFCSCVSKGGLSPEKYEIEESCEAHGRTFFKITTKQIEK